VQIAKNRGQAALFAVDLRTPTAYREVVERDFAALGDMLILINNTAYQIE